MKKLKNLWLSILSVAVIGSAALGFAGCNLLTSSSSASSSSSNENESSQGGPMQDGDMLEFTLSDDGTYYTVTDVGYYDKNDLIIPDSHKGLPVKAIGEKAFFEESGITSVTIPKTVISIGESAFEGCSGLAELTIENGVQSIGNKAFSRCINVKFAILPDSVNAMGSEVFSECQNLYILTSWTEQPEGWAEDWFVVDSEGNGTYYDGLDWETVEKQLYIYEDWRTINEATCYQNGEERRDCINVDGHYQTRPIPAAHDTVSHEGQAATCTQNGWEAYETCNNCAYTSYAIIRAEGHKYENGICSVCQQGYSEGLIYTLSDDKTYYIVSASKEFTANELSIAPTYENLPVKEIKASAFKNNTTITYATIPDSITKIGESAFSNCTALTGMYLSKNVTYIGASAFFYCSALTNITIPESVTFIGNSAFNSCLAVTDLHYDAINLTAPSSTYNNLIFTAVGMKSDGITLTIGKNVTQIPAYLFHSGTTTPASIVTLTFEEGSVCEKIGNEAFRGLKKLENVYLPNSALKIGDNAFNSCNALETLVIPDGVTEIGKFAFSYCKALTSLTIGKGITSLGNSAFDNCVALTSIYYNATACNNLSFGNYVFSCIGQESDGVCLTIGKDVKVLPSYIFSPYGSAEKYAPNVTKLVFEENCVLETINSFPFDDCVNVKELYYDGSIEINCTNLLTQNVGKNSESFVATIGKHAKNIPFGFFSLVPITEIIFEEGSVCESIGESAFTNSKIAEIAIPDSVKSIEKSAFDSCKNLTSITIPDSVTFLGESAFTWCTNMESVVIGNGISAIERATFYGCSKLTNFTFGSNIRSIGYTAFYNSSALTNVYYTGSVADWCSIEFKVAESNPLYYANNLYIDGTLMTTLVVPDSVSEIKNYAFYQYEGLKEIVLPKNLTSVGDYAFYRCDIDCVYFSGSEEDWTKIVFGSNTSNLTSATRYYFSENEPTENGNYWHYDAGEIVLWFPEEE